MSATLAKSMLFLAVLITIAALAFQRPLKPGEEGAMFTNTVAEQAAPAAQPDNPAEDGDQGPGMAESALAQPPVAAPIKPAKPALR
jgi:hypothetical protein